MSIVSSVAVVGHLQRDGRRYVTERHTDHLGAVHAREYLAPFGQTQTERDALLAQHATEFALSLAVAEYLLRVSEDGWPGPLEHQTAAQFADKLRFEYRESVRERVCYLAWWLLRRINEGSFTDAQVRNAFGMTAQQYGTFKTNKLEPFHDHWAAVLTAMGE
jgi:hypothetical protein